MFQQRPVWRYLRVTGRVKLWVSGLLPVVSTATVIRKQSLERHYVTAEVQHRAQNKRHHFQRRESSCRSFGGTHKWISATRVQFIWTLTRMSSTTNTGWEVEVVTVTVLRQRLTSEKSIFYATLTTRIWNSPRRCYLDSGLNNLKHCRKCRAVISPHYNVARSIAGCSLCCVLPCSNRNKKKKEKNNFTLGMFWVYLARRLNSWWCQVWFPAPARR